MEPPVFTQEDGQTVTISGEFRSAPRRRATVTWNMAKFAALANEAGADSQVSTHYLFVVAHPGGPGRITGGSFSPTLVACSLPGGDDQDRTFELSFGNP